MSVEKNGTASEQWRKLADAFKRSADWLDDDWPAGQPVRLSTMDYRLACDGLRMLADALEEVKRLKAAYEGDVTVDECIELAEALEQNRALHIVGAVHNLPIGGRTEAMPTAFHAGFCTACEEIEHRLRTEEWEWCLPPVGAVATSAATTQNRATDQTASAMLGGWPMAKKRAAARWQGMERRAMGKPTEGDSMNRLRVQAVREVARLKDVLELVRDCSSQEWQQADGNRMAAIDNQGRRFWFITEDVMQAVREVLGKDGGKQA